VPTDSFFPNNTRFVANERRAGLAGRAADMRSLELACAAVRDRQTTHTVTVVGATGIGKTRLVRDFLVKLREGTEGAPRVYRGSAREGGPAYEVFARVLRARFGILEGMAQEAAKAQVRAQLARVLDDRKVGDVAYFLGQLLELNFQDSPLIKAVEGDSAQMRSMRRAIIKSFIDTDAGKAKEPLVLLFDDLQWADDDSLELLSYLVESLRGPTLILCLARPEMLARHDGWRRAGAPRHSVLDLSPLSDGDAAMMMRDLLSPCGDEPEVDDLVDTAVTMAGGNPALLEQMVRIYHDTGVLEVTDDFEDERWSVHTEKLVSVKVPLTVQDAVQARIAALTLEERSLLERAAAMGGVFWLGALVAIRRLAESPPDVWEGGEAEDVVALRAVLTELVDRDYVLRLPDSTFPGDEEYVFKHNLEREALVRLTSPAAARRHHRAIAECLSFRESAATSEEYLEMLARHREKAGAPALAAASYVDAGEEARSRNANAKAAELFAKGLGLLDQCDPADEDLRLKTLRRYGDVLHVLGRNEEAHQAFDELATRAWRLDLRGLGAIAHSRIGRIQRDTGRLDEASRQLTAALALFGQSHDETGTADALDDIGRLHWLRGDYALALEYTARSLAMRRKLGDPLSIASSLNSLGLVQQDSGSLPSALESFTQALRIRKDSGDVVGAGSTLNSLGAVARDMGDDEKALAYFQEAYLAAKDMGFRNRTALILTNLGALQRRRGDDEKGAALLKQAEDLADEGGDRLALADVRTALGRAYLERGDVAKARESVERAVALFAAAGSRAQQGVALRLLGEIAAATGGGAPSPEALTEAADLVKQSMGIFDAMGNELELARSCRAYAALLRRMPDHQSNADAAAEAAKLAGRADDIFAKIRATTASIAPGAFQ
jgi:tetratricopeptide (TPR) repeat protein